MKEDGDTIYSSIETCSDDEEHIETKATNATATKKSDSRVGRTSPISELRAEEAAIDVDMSNRLGSLLPCRICSL